MSFSCGPDIAASGVAYPGPDLQHPFSPLPTGAITLVSVAISLPFEIRSRSYILCGGIPLCGSGFKGRHMNRKHTCYFFFINFPIYLKQLQKIPHS